MHSNERGTITFATSGKDSRTTQVGDVLGGERIYMGGERINRGDGRVKAGDLGGWGG